MNLKEESAISVLAAYKSSRKYLMQEFPEHKRSGKVLVIDHKDYSMMWPARHGHLATVQLTEKGNLSARLPLDRRLNKIMMKCDVILLRKHKSYFYVAKDRGENGEHFAGKNLGDKEVMDIFSKQGFINWKFPRKIKKQYKHFAAIGRQIEENERTKGNYRRSLKG